LEIVAVTEASVFQDVRDCPPSACGVAQGVKT